MYRIAGNFSEGEIFALNFYQVVFDRQDDLGDQTPPGENSVFPHTTSWWWRVEETERIVV